MIPKKSDYQISIVVLDGYLVSHGDVSWESLKKIGSLAVYPESIDSEEITQHIGNADVLFTNRCTLTAQHMENCPNLKFIGTFGTGYNNIDLDAANRLNISVCNVPNYSTYAVAQAAIALLLELANRTSQFSSYVEAGRWRKPVDSELVMIPQIELLGKTMGIIGLGNIGRQTGRIAAALGMHVLGYKNSAAKYDSEIELCGLDKLLEVADVVSIHCPLNESTRGMVNSEFLSKMQQGSILINTARGAIVHNQAIADALDSRHLLWYAADVLDQEPPPQDHPLIHRNDCIITPHVGWSPKETRQRLVEICADNLSCFLKGKPINQVNK